MCVGYTFQLHVNGRDIQGHMTSSLRKLRMEINKVFIKMVHYVWMEEEIVCFVFFHK